MLREDVAAAVVLSPSQASESPGVLVKTQVAGPHPRVSDTVGLGWGQRISNKFPGNAVVPGPQTTL